MSRDRDNDGKGRAGPAKPGGNDAGDLAAYEDLDLEPEADELHGGAHAHADLDDDEILSAEAEQRALPELAELQDGAAASGERPLRVIAVTGARGGAGRTVIASNLALYLATIGRKVVAVDADPSGANLHTCLGMRRPIS